MTNGNEDLVETLHVLLLLTAVLSRGESREHRFSRNRFHAVLSRKEVTQAQNITLITTLCASIASGTCALLLRVVFSHLWLDYSDLTESD